MLGKHPRTEAEIKLMEGRYGAYVTDGKTNATLPKTIETDALTLEEAAQLIDARAGGGAEQGQEGGRRPPAEEGGAEEASAQRPPRDMFRAATADDVPALHALIHAPIAAKARGRAGRMRRTCSTGSGPTLAALTECSPIRISICWSHEEAGG